MTYTSCIRIVDKAYGKTCQLSRIQCYVSVITEKYDLSFQLAYHTLAFDFQTTSPEGQALLNMSKIQQIVVLDLRTSNILSSALPTIDQLISKTFHLEGNQRILKTKRYTENTKKTSSGEKSRWVNARLRLQQPRIRRIHVADLALSYLLRQFLQSGKTR